MYRPGTGVSDHQCGPSGPRKSANDTLMASNSMAPSSKISIGCTAAGAFVLAAVGLAHAQMLGAHPNTSAPALSTPVAAVAHSAVPVPACNAPTELVRFGHALPRTARRLASGEALTIVAIGSSSTA